MIEGLKGYWILDSRGNPTIEVELKFNGKTVRASCPSGASTGTHEVFELRDGKKDFHGKGVKKAIKNVKEIENILIRRDPRDWKELDKLLIELDGTSNLSRLGGNTITAVSIALVKAASKIEGKKVYEYIGNYQKMPAIMSNIINGGKHAGNKLSIQEFMIIAEKGLIREKIKAISEIYIELKNILKNKYGKYAINVGDEGGFAPPIDKTEDALEIINKAMENTGYKLKIGLDSAASEFYKDGKYFIDGKYLNKDELLDFYIELNKKFSENIKSIEDPFYEEDFDAFSEIRKKFNGWIIGDDLLTTNPKRIKIAIEKRSVNGLLLKINQIGTVSEAINSFNLAKKTGWIVVVSHRSGETEDVFIADFAVGINSDAVKFGAPARGERTAKYNQLLRIGDKIENTNY